MLSYLFCISCSNEQPVANPQIDPWVGNWEGVAGLEIDSGFRVNQPQIIRYEKGEKVHTEKIDIVIMYDRLLLHFPPRDYGPYPIDLSFQQYEKENRGKHDTTKVQFLSIINRDDDSLVCRLTIPHFAGTFNIKARKQNLQVSRITNPSGNMEAVMYRKLPLVRGEREWHISVWKKDHEIADWRKKDGNVSIFNCSWLGYEMKAIRWKSDDSLIVRFKVPNDPSSGDGMRRKRFQRRGVTIIYDKENY